MLGGHHHDAGGVSGTCPSGRPGYRPGAEGVASGPGGHRQPGSGHGSAVKFSAPASPVTNRTDNDDMPDIEITAAVLGRVIVQAGRMIDGPFTRVIERYGITRNAWWLLTELYRTRSEEVATIGEHARRSGLAASSATIATEQLAKRRMVRRWRPKDNRRASFVTITDTGIELVDNARSDLERSVAALYEIFDQDDRCTLHDLLSRLLTDGLQQLDEQG